MNDYLRAAVGFLPYVTVAVLTVAYLLPLLWQTGPFGPRSEDVGGGRRPMQRRPVNGYTYHINASDSVLICPGWFGSYRVYPLQGEPPSGAALLNDRYGSFFPVYAASADAAERELDQLYLGGRGA